MKKIILTIFVCLFFTAIASAQTDYAASFTAGIKGGADYSSFPAYTGFTNKGQIGWIGGFWGNLNLGPVNFQPEIYGTEKSVDVTYTQPGNIYSEDSRYTTVDVPLLFGGKFGDAKFAFRVYTGPVLSLAISKVQSFTQDNTEPQRLDYKDENIAWQIGAGVTFKAFTIDARYEYGINSVGYGPEPTSSTHMNVMSLSIGYTLFSSYGYYTYQ